MIPAYINATMSGGALSPSPNVSSPMLLHEVNYPNHSMLDAVNKSANDKKENNKH